MVKPGKGDGLKAQEKKKEKRGNVLTLYKNGFENGSRVVWL